jgi:hypothetical protein
MRPDDTRPADVPLEPDAESPRAGDPAEGRPDLGIPGADRPDEQRGREHDLPERLGERIYGGEKGIASGEPDLKPDVEIPDETM